MKKKIIILVSILVFIILMVSIYFISLMPVSKNDDKVTFKVSTGQNKLEIVSNLKKAGLIKSKYTAFVYVFLHPKLNLQAGNYTINKNNSVKEIINMIDEGKVDDPRNIVKIRFNEAKSINVYLKQIAENFNITYEDEINKLKDEKFLDELIESYDFLTDDIKNKDIYYSLEGYLYPDTYEFFEDTTFENIIKTMLNNTKNKISSLDFSKEVNGKKYSIHELFTIASIIEQEAVTKSDREKVSQVIYTRLNKNVNLGMDVTSYYGAHKSLKEAITSVDLNANNPYNTRVLTFKGLPIGPICNPSVESLNAALNPSNTNYEYFIADLNTGVVSFTESYEEFLKLKKKLGV